MATSRRQEWQARSTSSVQARSIASIALVMIVLFGVPNLEQGLTTFDLVKAGACVLVAVAGALWLRKLSKRVERIRIDGDKLVIGRRGHHRLGKGSLHAAPVAWQTGIEATVLFVRLERGQLVSLACPGLLPNELYAGRTTPGGELHLDDDGTAGALLERLHPFIMPMKLGDAARGYTFALRGEPTQTLDLRDGWVRIFERNGIIAEAPVNTLVASAHSFTTTLESLGEDDMRRVALALTFPRTHVQVVVWARAADLEGRWASLPSGPPGTHEIGYAELMCLMDATGMQRPPSRLRG